MGYVNRNEERNLGYNETRDRNLSCNKRRVVIERRKEMVVETRHSRVVTGQKRVEMREGI